jgi:phosphoribulokinase
VEGNQVPDKEVALHRVGRADAPRPVMLAIAGDSAAGKTTVARGLLDALGPDRSRLISVDDYHRFDRPHRQSLSVGALHPANNYVRMVEHHLRMLKLGLPVLKPVYRSDGTLRRPALVEPSEFVVIEGLLPLYTRRARTQFDLSVYLDPPEPLRYRWKIRRDASARGCTPDAVRAELERREADSAAFVRPQRAHADIVVRFEPRTGQLDDDNDLNAILLLRSTAPHADLSRLLAGHLGPTVGGVHTEHRRERRVVIVRVDAALSWETTQHAGGTLWKELGGPRPGPMLGALETGVRSPQLGLVLG